MTLLRFHTLKNEIIVCWKFPRQQSNHARSQSPLGRGPILLGKRHCSEKRYIHTLNLLLFRWKYNFIVIGYKGYSSQLIRWEDCLIKKEAKPIITEVISPKHRRRGRLSLYRVAF